MCADELHRSTLAPSDMDELVNASVRHPKSHSESSTHKEVKRPSAEGTTAATEEPTTAESLQVGGGAAHDVSLPRLSFGRADGQRGRA
eukprot:6459689-Amphidinium_carterae.1